VLSKQHLWKKKKGFENVQILVGDVRIENVTILVIAVDDQLLVFTFQSGTKFYWDSGKIKIGEIYRSRPMD